MLNIALTGGIASGKSTVAHLFAQHGIAIIDTDVIARDVVLPNTNAWTKIVAHFGDEILSSDGTLNRALLREKIFNNATERKWLESLLHPIIRQKMLADMAAATSPYCIAVIPLLTATSHEGIFDRLLVVTCDRETQISRLVKRDHLNETQAEKMIAAQISDEERLLFADDMIKNTNNQHLLENRVNVLHENYLKISKKK